MKKLALGFTLIELLVVISIIGILATLVAANLNSARSRARDAARKSDMRNVATALRLYFNDRGTYPASNASGQIVGCTSYITPAACTPGGSWVVGTTTYMTVFPKDPLPGQVYYYSFVDSDNYILRACLENKSDSSGITDPSTASWCPSTTIFQIKP